ncbi:hypothetical protein T552_02262 [Pneumocystis carinii B80]|uniref:THUMP domain-containing protein n=1 Tax=Pneumocystis carinii (strain B80) TaxID=1408658 RepID=A0A0W4ZFY7_PNEC8|nr:hypothetical protein T552_02262 [Pneumocystis carinii B80]KTW27279.1 hypothetical protein T552_02262 [Pneumocystis carinii B80]
MLLPNWSGVFITCVRKHEKQAEREVLNLFYQYLEEQAPELFISSSSIKSDDACVSSEELLNITSGSLEDQISQELAILKKKERWLQPINIKTSCVIFIRTRWPLDPVQIVRYVCEKICSSGVKGIRWSKRMTPVTLTASATLLDLQNLAEKVLQPYFHENKLEPLRESFAIRPNLRNHTKLTREQIIRTIVPLVGAPHKVDLKNYDVLIMVEIFKNICGISIVRDFEKLKKLNIMSIMESYDQKNVKKTFED